ncbi:hypothetical protein ACWDKQ_05730 [Saccharopolyspora sp. NPDC000995]
MSTDIDPFEDPYAPPEIVVGKPITGNGIAAIRQWVTKVERHFGGQGLATCHYAALLGYWANLGTFRVEITDRKLADAADIHRDRLTGHAQRLVAAGFLVKWPKRAREKGTQYVLSLPQTVTL